MSRVYLDWNATTPLRPQARAAMLSAMDAVGNPSSVHAEGRAALGIVSKARDQIASAFGCKRDNIIFTSSATEAAALGLKSANDTVLCADVEHDCITTNSSASLGVYEGAVETPADQLFAQQGANSETGILQNVTSGAWLSDQVQSFGKIPVAFNFLEVSTAILSAHKIGGPKGIGALVLADGVDVKAQIQGGGQEEGRRSGTENVIGIAGFGASAQAAQEDIEEGVWQKVEGLRDMLEAEIANIAQDAFFVGQNQPRLPNTSCFAVPGWKGETQVMQMDLAGFAISAGSACSSGKVKQSRVLKAMGYDDLTSSSAIRVSLGPATTEEEIMRFIQNWAETYKRYKAKAA